MSSETPVDSQLLDNTSVLPYLHARGVLETPTGTARPLAGGVSNVVLLVESAGRRVVVKQALERLRVADLWLATRARAQAEAHALQLLAAITPDAVPRVLDHDPTRFALTIEAAPPHWCTWKERLFAGRCDPTTAQWLGEVLRNWHSATDDRPLPTELEDAAAFQQLRIDPYFTVSARREPKVATRLKGIAAEVLSRRRCLVSGDYSPKNVLLDDRTGWVIDLEVAHRGDPAFDVAFMLNHLLLKAVHLPSHRSNLRRCADSFLAAYGDTLGTDDPGHLHGLIGCLLLARVVGSSPVEYLTKDEQERVRNAAITVLQQAPATFGDLWRAVIDA